MLKLKKNHIAFLVKCFVVAFPLLFVLALYFVTNPFGILPYSFLENKISEKSSDIQSTRNFLDNYKTKKYNTFIFGNSRANAFVPYFQDYFNQSILLKYNSPGESVRNIYRKVKLIDSLGLNLKYVIIHMDEAILENVNNTNPYKQGPAYLHHPLTAPSSNFYFQTKGLAYFFEDLYFLPYSHYLLTKSYHPYMKKYFNETYNKNTLPREELANKFGEQYYIINKEIFPERNKVNKTIGVNINNSDILLLLEILKIFKKHNTDYKISFSINYHMRKMNKKVITIFETIYGKQNVYDFTGKNSISQELGNFYEPSHFKKKAGKMILDSIYSKPK